jgi:hypothetical protein
VGIDIYQNWKAPVAQALQTSKSDWEDISKRTPRPPQTLKDGLVWDWDYYYYDWNEDGEVDGVSKFETRILIVPPEQNVPTDYYVDSSGSRIYYGNSTLVPRGSTVYRHISRLSSEAEEYQDDFVKAKFWQKHDSQKPGTLSVIPDGIPPSQAHNIWE